MKLENFIKGTGLLNLVLCFGIVFFAGTYYELLTKITNPNSYLSYAIVLFGSLFFGLLTFVIIRNVQNIIIKISFAFLEFWSVMLHYLSAENFYIIIFVSVLASLGVFTLAYISTELQKSKEVVSTELQDLQQSNSELTAELLNNQNELLNTQNELLLVTQNLEQVTQSKEEVTQELLTQTSLLSEKSDYTAIKVQLQESRGEVDRLREYEALWLDKRAKDKTKGNRKKTTICGHCKNEFTPQNDSDCYCGECEGRGQNQFLQTQNENV